MMDLTGRELEDYGKELFNKISLLCIHRLNNVRLLDLYPRGSYSEQEHLEVDYLLPYNNICLVGEITGRATSHDVRKKYSKFRTHYNTLKNSTFNESFWEILGVPEEQVRNFRQVNELRGFFVTTRLEKFDVNLSRVSEIICLYKVDWHLLKEYSQSIGQYTKHHFLHLFNIQEPTPRDSITLHKDSHSLIRIPNKKIASGDIGLADLYTFYASPYELLPIAKVFRRDELPSLLSEEPDYQRPLIPSKLKSIRENLLINQDFIFPGTILVVLSNDCRYSVEDETLIIPKKYGSISVIDGQHRLFSYADDDIEEHIGDDSRIMITAIQFRNVSENLINIFGAKTFIEINTNQTRVHPTHLDAIAYPILGVTGPRALAAQIILKANESRSSSLYGIFSTNQTGLGTIRSITVLMALKSIINFNYIKGLQNSQRGSRLLIRSGYENLFGVQISQINNANDLIDCGVACFKQYFNRIKRIFNNDWPVRGQIKNSSFEYAKFFASWVKLLSIFISEGLNWQSIETELIKIKSNVLLLIRMNNYDSVLFDPSNPDIPDYRPSTADDYRFLNENRTNPTSIQEILKQ